MDILEPIIKFIDSSPEHLIYVLLGASAFLENIFPPTPGDTITAFGAFLVGTRNLSFFGVLISTSLGSLGGFMFLYWIGILLGRRFFMTRDLWLFRAEKIRKAEEWFRKYGYYLILINRFMPAIRSVISIACGILRLDPLRVILFALISTILWNSIWVSLGYFLGNNWDRVQDRLGNLMLRYNLAVFAAIAVVALFFVIRWWLKKNKK